jgi:hypothetical protein
MIKIALISMFSLAIAILAFAASAMPAPTLEDMGGGWVVIETTAAL